MGILARLGFAIYLLAVLAGLVVIGFALMGAWNEAYGAGVMFIVVGIGVGIILLGRLVYWVLAGE